MKLRALVPSDSPALFEIFGHAEVMRYWIRRPYENEDVARALVTRIEQAFREKSLFQWGITIDDADRVVGTCTLGEANATHRRAELGYALGRAHWGGGIMNEALTLLLDFAFGPLNLRRVEADIDPRNTPSLRAVERLGFVREGVLRERWCVEGEISDTVFYGLLQREWHGRGNG